MKALPEVDQEGFLRRREDWSVEVAVLLAETEGVTLSDAHWALIHLVQNFYERFDVSPAMRPLIKQIREQLGDDKANSIYLLSLFPGSPAKLLAKIAGLPRPTNCL